MDSIDYTLHAMAAGACLGIGYVIIRSIPYISRFAVIIVLLAGIATAASLLYSTGKELKNTSIASSKFVSPETLELYCGEVAVGKNSCYEEVEYRGYPFRMIQVTYPYDAEPRISNAPSPGRGSAGILANFLVYLALFGLSAALIKKTILRE